VSASAVAECRMPYYSIIVQGDCPVPSALYLTKTGQNKTGHQMQTRSKIKAIERKIKLEKWWFLQLEKKEYGD